MDASHQARGGSPRRTQAPVTGINADPHRHDGQTVQWAIAPARAPRRGPLLKVKIPARRRQPPVAGPVSVLAATPENETGVRDRAIILTAVLTGLRREDLIGLTKGSITLGVDETPMAEIRTVATPYGEANRSENEVSTISNRRSCRSPGSGRGR